MITAITVASSVAAVASDASPTGNTWADAVWNAAVGATLARATVDARRWTWFPMAGLAATVADGLLALACGLGSLAGVFAAGFFTRRSRWIGALTGALAAQALLRGHTYGFTGLPTIVAVLACTPLLVSAYRNASSTTRRVARRGALIAGAVIAVLTVFTAVSALRARDRFQEAIRFADAAVDAAEGGDQEIAASLINASAEELDAVATDFDRPWLYPARWIPVLGQHSAVLGDVADAGAAVATDAADVLVALQPDVIVKAGGNIDVQAVQDVVDPMANLAASLQTALDDISDIDETWLARPAEERVDELVAELESTFDTVEVADELVAIAPDMLGADEPRRYLVLFTTAAESRGLGGFAGNWAELVIDQGQLELVDVGRGDDITNALPTGGVFVPNQLRRLYQGFELETTFQNVTAVPDFPSAASVARYQFEAAFDREVHGVISIDHAGMGGIVALTGPVVVDAMQMNAAQIEEFIVRDQYEIYADDNDRRLEVLEDLTFTVFDQLVNADLPSPSRIVDVFGPLIDGNHLRVTSFDNREFVSLDKVGLTGSFHADLGQDLVAVVTQNLGENKIDVFLDRTIAYDTTVDPDTGRVESTLTVTLVNNAPADGLPQAIIGNNDQGLPIGTNRIRVQLYTPLEATSATLDGDDILLTGNTEFGWTRLVRDLWLDAGQTEVLQVTFAGQVDTTDGYLVEIHHQPLVNTDSVDITVHGANSKKIERVLGLDPQGRASVALESDLRLGYIFGS